MAQIETAKELREFALERKEIRRYLDGLSNTVRYGLADKSYRALPALLKRNFGILVTEPDVERYVKEKGIALYYSYNFEP